MVVANIILPAPSIAYFASIFLPLATLAALAVECVVYLRFSTKPWPWPAIVAGTLVANIVSWIAGVALTALLPSGYVPQLTESGDQIMVTGPHWSTYAFLSFPLACLLSFVLELGVFYPFRGQLRIGRPVAAVAVANIASYTLLGLLVLVYGL